MSAICGRATVTQAPSTSSSLPQRLPCATDDADAMANAMRWVREHYDQLPEMGHHSRQLAAGYSAQVWADRWLNMFKELDV